MLTNLLILVQPGYIEENVITYLEFQAHHVRVTKRVYNYRTAQTKKTERLY